jgi:hypothetical protein
LCNQLCIFAWQVDSSALEGKPPMWCDPLRAWLKCARQVLRCSLVLFDYVCSCVRLNFVHFLCVCLCDCFEIALDFSCAMSVWVVFFLFVRMFPIVFCSIHFLTRVFKWLFKVFVCTCVSVHARVTLCYEIRPVASEAAFLLFLSQSNWPKSRKQNRSK